jgi:23S rRNA C2498 (ribose-2'-O)-methylase RlmM
MCFVSLYCDRGFDFGCCAEARDKAIELFLECEVGKFGSEQTVEVGDAVKGKGGN